MCVHHRLKDVHLWTTVERDCCHKSTGHKSGWQALQFTAILLPRYTVALYASFPNHTHTQWGQNDIMERGAIRVATVILGKIHFVRFLFPMQENSAMTVLHGTNFLL